MVGQPGTKTSNQGSYCQNVNHNNIASSHPSNPAHKGITSCPLVVEQSGITGTCGVIPGAERAEV